MSTRDHLAIDANSNDVSNVYCHARRVPEASQNASFCLGVPENVVGKFTVVDNKKLCALNIADACLKIFFLRIINVEYLRSVLVRQVC